MSSKAGKLRVTLEQIRIYKKQPRYRSDPCSEKLMGLMSALEANEGKVDGRVYKYVKDVEKCYEMVKQEQTKKGKAGTLYYLSQYLDLNKFKKK
mmetsp:Transcript_10474/g.28843  ORF Transcript_10474/g.28843 Transcript_10474/m.28843 type:complete len:94 (-) Transcript_10474:1012-1293(-)